jgi:hypothetical protein
MTHKTTFSHHAEIFGQMPNMFWPPPIYRHSFKEIAGNDSAILLTVLVPADNTTTFENSQIVFTQPISSHPTMKRIAMATPVSALGKILLQLDRKKIKVEHVFDY